MGFSIFEIGNRTGKAVSLYELSWGDTFWRYTSADRNIQWPYIDGDPENGVWWEAVGISDEGFTMGPQAEPLQVSLPYRLPVCQLFRSTPPSSSIWLKVKRFHRTDPDQEGVTYWIGTVSNVKRKGPIAAALIGLPITGAMKRLGLRMGWERNCQHALYGPDCRANKELFKTEAVITAMTGTTITVDTIGAYAGAQYNGGLMEWVATDEGTIDRRTIEFYEGDNTFTLFGTTDRLEIGMAISLFLGCDLTAGTCSGTFNNLANHGGMHFLPGESPFDGRQLWY